MTYSSSSLPYVMLSTGLDANNLDTTALSFHFDEFDDRDKGNPELEAQADEDDKAKKALVTKQVYELLLQRAAEEAAQKRYEDDDDSLAGTLSLPSLGLPPTQSSETNAYDAARQTLRDKQRLEEELQQAHTSNDELNAQLARLRGELERYRGQAVSEAQRQSETQSRMAAEHAEEKRRLEEALRDVRTVADKSGKQVERLVQVCKAEVDAIKKTALSDAESHESAQREWKHSLATHSTQAKHEATLSQSRILELERVVESMTLLLQDAREKNASSVQNQQDVDVLREQKEVMRKKIEDLEDKLRFSIDRERASSAQAMEIKQAHATLQDKLTASQAQVDACLIDNQRLVTELKTQSETSHTLQVNWEASIEFGKIETARASELDVLAAQLRQQLGVMTGQKASAEAQVGMLTDQVDSLERRVRACSQEKRAVDEEVVALQGQVGDLTSARDRSLRTVADLQAQCRQDDVDIEAMKVQMAKGVETVSDLRQQLILKDTACEKISNDLDAMRPGLEALRTELVRMQEQANIEQSHTSSIRQVKEQLLSQLQSAQEENESYQKQRKINEKLLSEAQTRLESLETQLSACDRQRINAERTSEDANGRIAYLVGELKTASDHAANLQRQLSRVREENADLESRVFTSQSKVTELGGRLQASTDRSADLQNQLATVSTGLTVMERQLRTSQDQLMEYQSQLETIRLEDYAGKLIVSRKEMEDWQSQYRQSTTRITELEGQRDRSRSEIGNLHSQLFASDEAVKNGLERIKDKDKLLTECRAQIQQLQHELLAVQTDVNRRDVALIESRECHAALERMLEAQGAVLLSVQAEKTKADLAYTSKIEALMCACADKDEDLARLRQEVTAAGQQTVAENKGLKVDVERLTTHVQTLQLAAEQTISRHASEQANKDRELSVLKSDVEAAMLLSQANAQSWQEQRETLMTANATSDARINELEGQKRSSDDELAALRKRIAELEAALEQSTDDLAAMTKLHAELVTSSTAAKTTGDKVIDVLKKQVVESQATSSATITDLQAQLKSSQDELATLVTAGGKRDTDAAAALRMRIAELEASLKTSNDEMSALAAQHTELTAAKALYDKEVKDLSFERYASNDSNAAFDKQIQLLKASADKDAVTITVLEADKVAHELLRNDHMQLIAAMKDLQAVVRKSKDNDLSIEAQIDELKSTSDHLSHELETTNEQLHKLRMEKLTLTSEQQHCKDNIVQLTHQLALAQKNGEDKDQEIAALRQALQEAELETSSVAQKMAEQKRNLTQMLRKQLEDNDAKLDEAKGELLVALAATSSLQGELQTLRASYDTAQHQLVTLTATHNETIADLADSRSQWGKCQIEKEALVNEQANKVADLERLITSLKQSLKDIKQQVADTQASSTVTDMELNDEKQRVKVLELQNSALESALKKSNDDVVLLTKTNNELSTAKAVASKEAVQWRVKAEQFENELSILEKDKVDVESRVQGISNQLDEMTRKVTIELAPMLLAAKKEIEELKYAVNLKQQQLLESEAAEKQGTAVAKTHKSQLEELHQTIETLTAQLATAEQNRQGKDQEVAALSLSLMRAREEALQLEVQAQQWKDKAGQFSSQLTNEKESNIENEVMLRSKDKEINTLKREQQERDDEIAVLGEQVQLRKEKLVVLTSQLTAAQQSNHDRDSELRKKDNEITVLKLSEKEGLEQASALERQLQLLKDQSALVSTQLASAQHSHSGQKIEIANLKQAVNEGADDIASLRGQLMTIKQQRQAEVEEHAIAIGTLQDKVATLVHASSQLSDRDRDVDSLRAETAGLRAAAAAAASKQQDQVIRIAVLEEVNFIKHVVVLLTYVNYAYLVYFSLPTHACHLIPNSFIFSLSLLPRNEKLVPKIIWPASLISNR